MATTNYYTFGGAIRGENQVGGTGYRAYGPDALGSVCQTYDSTGTLQDTFRYSPYGRSIVSTGSAAAPAYLWVGSLGYRNNAREFFEYYVRARHYSSLLGVWTKLDAQWPGERAYCYVNSNPVVYVDPSGNGSCWIIQASAQADQSKLNLHALGYFNIDQCAGLELGKNPRLYISCTLQATNTTTDTVNCKTAKTSLGIQKFKITFGGSMANDSDEQIACVLMATLVLNRAEQLLSFQELQLSALGGCTTTITWQRSMGTQATAYDFRASDTIIRTP